MSVLNPSSRAPGTSLGAPPGVRAAIAVPGMEAFSAALSHAARCTLDPQAGLLVWAEAALLQAADLPNLAPQAQVWASSPWAESAAGAPAAGPAWQQVLVLARGPAPGEQALQHLFLRLCDSGAQRVTLVLLPGSANAVALRHAVEAQAYAMGLRKSPHYYQAVGYEALHQEQGPVVIALERVPDAAVLAYPLRALSEERDLHMDMLREVGERSDAHVIRYQLAAALIRPGDHVLDSACGLGYGSHLLARLTGCASVLGVDGSDYAVRYAQMNFAAVEPRLQFDKAWLPQDLARLADRRFDVIVSFETLEHIADPEGLLAQFNRLLRPGGRIIVSVPNDWSDETGEDPNPHHLHVYTLDKLRHQFSRHFKPGALHQQIASGCKAQARQQQWTAMPRALQAVPLDTQRPPDAEWWIMAGTKPAAEARPAPAPEAPPAGVQGLVLAVNCTPEDADPAVAAFWGQLHEHLGAQGQQLVIASTTPLSNPALQVLEIPFELPAFAERFPLAAGQATAVPPALLDDLVRWYGCPAEQAAAGWQQAQAFFDDLLQTLRPSAVLGWQSVNPVTRVLRQAARAADVPFWAGERGWLRNTLMFDTLENNALGEANLSLGLARLRASSTPSAATLQRLQARAQAVTDLARYPGEPPVTGAALRQRLGIPAGDTVVAFFGHGEPSFGTWQSGPMAQLHGVPAGQLQARLDAVSDALLARGAWLLVQEHPFNRARCNTLQLGDSPRVVSVAENVGSVVDAADACLFTQATLQFDVACLGHKPFGLLARSPLYRAGTPPLFGDHPSADAFLDSVMDPTAWPARRVQLQADIAFLYDTLLLDIAPDAVAPSAAHWARHLGQLLRPLDAGFDERVGRFLARWGDAG